MCPILKGHIDPRKEHGFLAAQPLRPTLKICHRHIFLTLRPRNDQKGAPAPFLDYPRKHWESFCLNDIAPRRHGAGFFGGYRPPVPPGLGGYP